MQKKIISQFTLQRTHSLLALNTFLFLLFFFPLLFSARASSIDEIGTNPQQQANQGKIYISAGAIVTGAENIHKGEIIVLKKPAKKENIISEKHSFSQVIKKAVVQKKEREKPKKENIVRLLDFNMSNSAGSNSDFTEKLGRFYKAVVPITNLLQKSSVITSYKENIAKISTQLKKQRSYTSIFFLQFRELRNSSLRGPPNRS